MKNTTCGRVFTMAALVAAALSAVPAANAAPHQGCSVLSLRGTFSDRDTGAIITPAAFAGPFAGANLETFDGNGVVKGSGVASINGNIAQSTFQGTYTVNPDCTGTYITQNSLGLTVHAWFVITDNGNQLDIVITDPGTVISCVARKQVPEGNSYR